jgi:hypothetical protein
MASKQKRHTPHNIYTEKHAGQEFQAFIQHKMLKYWVPYVLRMNHFSMFSYLKMTIIFKLKSHGAVLSYWVVVCCTSGEHPTVVVVAAATVTRTIADVAAITVDITLHPLSPVHASRNRSHHPKHAPSFAMHTRITLRSQAWVVRGSAA